MAENEKPDDGENGKVEDVSTLEPERYESPLTRSINMLKKPLEMNNDNYEDGGNPPPTDDYGEIDFTKFTHLQGKDDVIKNIRGLKGKDLFLKAIERENDYLNFQKLAEDRKVENEKLKSVKPDEKIEEYQKFINGMKSDFFGTYNKYADEYGLPDVGFIKNQINSGGSVEERLLQWQENELKPKIEKEFNIEDGTFVFDRDEANVPRTASYRFRTMTEDKEAELKKEFSESQTKSQERLTGMLAERENQLKRLKETFYPLNTSAYEAEQDEAKKEQLKAEAEKKAEDAFAQKLGVLDSAWEKMESGDFSPQGNPIAVENIFKGYFFDELAQAKVDAAVEALHKAYKEKGIFIKKQDLPEDLTKIPGDDLPSLTKDKNDRSSEYSPLTRMLNSYNKT